MPVSVKYVSDMRFRTSSPVMDSICPVQGRLLFASANFSEKSKPRFSTSLI